MSAQLPTESEWMLQFYDRKLESIVSGLRSLADKVEREGHPYSAGSIDDTPRYTDAAGRVIHSLHWGLANLSVDGLVTDAVRVDQAEAKQ